MSLIQYKMYCVGLQFKRRANEDAELIAAIGYSHTSYAICGAVIGKLDIFCAAIGGAVAQLYDAREQDVQGVSRRLERPRETVKQHKTPFYCSLVSSSAQRKLV